jgi:predicted glycoside hydrolase/deacetylase ChbG (UPF0249 family)
MSRFAPRPTHFALVADDFALSPSVSRAILALLAADRLSGAGAMTNRPFWKEGARDFAAFAGRADLGLHLNLTAGEALGPMPRLAPGGELPPAQTLLQKGLDRQASAEVEAEIIRQLQAFIERAGRLPDFIDGHQHVHVLPGVRRALFAALERFWPKDVAGPRPWLRDPADTPGRILARGVAAQKALTVAALALGFRRLAHRHGFSTNHGFAGFSAFDPTRDYAADFSTYLAAPGDAHLVMCHPGFVDDELRAVDTVLETRPREHEFLLSARFTDLCAEARMERVRLATLV